MRDATDLLTELDAWREASRTVDVWWRDDDAAEASPALDALVAAAHRHEAPLALAVIPAALSPRLVACRDDPLLFVLQHGYAHTNHAAPGGRAVECGGDRPLRAVLDELGTGRDRLAAAFGDRFVPVMVPPWNRIEPAVAKALPDLGYAGISVFGPRETASPQAACRHVNAHLDLLTWKGGARFAGRDKLIRLAAERLADLRLGRSDPQEPFGILTHHLDHDAETGAFLEELLALFAAHPAVRWRDAASLFAGPAVPAAGRR
ncbi:polysaccharide deacetylase family protein [Aurantimonas sp. A2-1-M11]|uniref:polysaccharide deacetylase family protein n=1 Tax=Aurantimonas sp. A2-1-M11 TaxID=3113712 RepID=UPI002F959430